MTTSSLLPSDEDVAFYREHGWYISKKIIPEDVLDDAAHGIERYYAGERDHTLPLSGGYLNWVPEHGPTLRINDYVSLQNDELQALVATPVLAQVAARLTGAREIRLFHDQLITKPPGVPGAETTIGWHVDRAYWRTCTSTSLLTAWIPLQDCTLDMGPLTFIDGSHEWEGHGWMTTFNERDLHKLEASFATGGARVDKVPMAIERGQVSFHHGMTIHGSLPNTSDRFRTTLTVHLQDDSNRYTPYVDERGREALHINDLLCRKGDDGYPDYADPEICPVLWREDPPRRT